MSASMATHSAFQEYGIQAQTMASSYNFATLMQGSTRSGTAAGGYQSISSRGGQRDIPHRINKSNAPQTQLPQLIDGYERNEAFAGIKKNNRQAMTAGAHHRRFKTIGDQQHIDELL